jgi:hypothetical protein
MDNQVRLNERTGRSVSARVGVYFAVAAVGGSAFAVGYGLTNWIVAYWFSLWLVGWLSNSLGVTEWTIADHELSRRRWLSRPGRTPRTVMELGPQVEIVHESWGRWRMRPSGFAIDIQPWQTSHLVGAMERAGVRVTDWRGDWARRHGLLNAIGVLALCGDFIALFVAAAFAPLRPESPLGLIAWLACVGALLLGLAIDFLPWTLQSSSADGGGPRWSAK